MKFTIKHENCRKLWIWSHLLKKSLMENFIFCALSGIVVLSNFTGFLYVVSKILSKIVE